MSLKKEKYNWYGIDHAAARKHYSDLDGNLEYVGTFTVNGNYKPAAVYHAPNPDKSKGHKEFILLFKDDVLLTMFVTGMTREQIAPFLIHHGVKCNACGEVVYSVMRHDMRYCDCKETFADGGRDYIRSSLGAEAVVIDLVSGATRPLTFKG